MPRTDPLESLEIIASEALGTHNQRVLQLSQAGAAGIMQLREGMHENVQGTHRRSFRSGPQPGRRRSFQYSVQQPGLNGKVQRAVKFLVQVLGNSTYLHVMQAASLSGPYSEPIILAEEERKYQLVMEPPVQEAQPHSYSVNMGGLALHVLIPISGYSGYSDEKITHIGWLPVFSGEERVVELGNLVRGVEELLSHYPRARIGIPGMRANFEAGLRMYVEALAKTAQAGR